MFTLISATRVGPPRYQQALATVGGSRRAPLGHCQEPRTERDDETPSALVRETLGQRALQCETNYRQILWGTTGDCRVKFLCVIQ